MRTSISLVLQPGNPECLDRAEVCPSGDRIVLLLADGAGGSTGGAQAADGFARLVRSSADQLTSANSCASILLQIDRELLRQENCGETTGALLVVSPQNIFGASVGDSAAWLFADDGNGELTRGQQRKPLLGSGNAVPRAFDWPIESGTLVVASDGLWNYVSMEAIRSRVLTRDSVDLALRLAELARLPSGTFPDDVAIITCRIELNDKVP